MAGRRAGRVGRVTEGDTRKRILYFVSRPGRRKLAIRTSFPFPTPATRHIRRNWRTIRISTHTVGNHCLVRVLDEHRSTRRTSGTTWIYVESPWILTREHRYENRHRHRRHHRYRRVADDRDDPVDGIGQNSAESVPSRAIVITASQAVLKRSRVDWSWTSGETWKRPTPSYSSTSTVRRSSASAAISSSV